MHQSIEEVQMYVLPPGRPLTKKAGRNLLKYPAVLTQKYFMLFVSRVAG